MHLYYSQLLLGSDFTLKYLTAPMAIIVGTLPFSPKYHNLADSSTVPHFVFVGALTTAQTIVNFIIHLGCWPTIDNLPTPQSNSKTLSHYFVPELYNIFLTLSLLEALPWRVSFVISNFFISISLTCYWLCGQFLHPC